MNFRHYLKIAETLQFTAKVPPAAVAGGEQFRMDRHASICEQIAARQNTWNLAGSNFYKKKKKLLYYFLQTQWEFFMRKKRKKKEAAKKQNPRKKCQMVIVALRKEILFFVFSNCLVAEATQADWIVATVCIKVHLHRTWATLWSFNGKSMEQMLIEAIWSPWFEWSAQKTGCSSILAVRCELGSVDSI